MKAKKSLGQNFLQNDTIINQIVSLFSCTSNDLIIEIGPGRGALTSKLVNKDAKLICIEVDTDLKKILDKYESDNCKIIYQDILTTNLNCLIDKDYENIYVIGNLPYYITSPIIEKLIESKINFKEMFFMVQNEVADRYCSKEKSSEYGYMTIYINHYYNVTKEIFVDKYNFNPVPKVDSAVIKLSKKIPYEIDNEKDFFDFIKTCFHMKRKNLKNNLKNYDQIKLKTFLKSNNLFENIRAEELSEKQLIDLYKTLK